LQTGSYLEIIPMDFHIRPYQMNDLDAILELSVLAWEPVFTEWERLVGPVIFSTAIHADWRKGQKEVVEKFVKEAKKPYPRRHCRRESGRIHRL